MGVLEMRAIFVGLILLAQASCAQSTTPMGPPGLSLDTRLVELTEAEIQSVCAYRLDRMAAVNGRVAGDRLCDPDGPIIEDPEPFCTLGIPGMVDSCPRTVGDYVRCIEDIEQIKAENGLQCDLGPTFDVDHPHCFRSAECLRCRTDRECQLCNDEGECRLPELGCRVEEDDEVGYCRDME